MEQMQIPVLVSLGMGKDFFSILSSSADRKDSLLCIGIDPQGKIDEADVYTGLMGYGERILDETGPYAAAFKPNVAFYEAFGPEGLKALKRTIEQVPGETPVILDAKRSDIGNTARAYAQSIFGYYNAQATTLNPYLGKESVLPFLEWEDRGLFILCRTSNPGSEFFQEPVVDVGRGLRRLPYYLHVALEVSSWGRNIGLVVAGNLPRALAEVRKLLPDIWILAPGIGAQGGDVDGALKAGLRRDGQGILVHASRSIGGADSPALAARKLRDAINTARKKSFPSGFRGTPYTQEGQEERSSLIRELISTGCFKTGSFQLKSGRRSPFYIDLRLIISRPPLLSRVASAYGSILAGIIFDRLAAVPMAGIPIATAVSLLSQKPMIFPRLEKKAHGTGRMIEGIYIKGDRVVLIDDLITAGTSKLEAIEVLRGEGLIVEDLVVLVERGRSGRRELEGAGVRLHAILDIDNFLEICLEMDQIDPGEVAGIRSFIAEG